MINAIFAVDSNGGLGKNGTLPWPRNKDDMKHFRDITLGNVVVMGRNTWMDPLMPKPLPDRENIVLATFPFISYPPGVKTFRDINSASAYFQTVQKDIWVIGGVKTLWSFRMAMLIDKIVITKFKIDYNCDVSINLNKYLVGYGLINKEDKNDCSIETYSKRK